MDALIPSPYTTTIYIVTSVLNVLSTIAVALRFQARRVKHLPLAADDYVIFATLVSSHSLELPQA